MTTMPVWSSKATASRPCPAPGTISSAWAGRVRQAVTGWQVPVAVSRPKTASRLVAEYNCHRGPIAGLMKTNGTTRRAGHGHLPSPGRQSPAPTTHPGCWTAARSWTRSWRRLRPRGPLVVWRLDRLGRSMCHLVDTVSALDEWGLGFRSLRESIDTTTAGRRLVFHLSAGPVRAGKHPGPDDGRAVGGQGQGPQRRPALEAEPGPGAGRPTVV